MIKYEYNQQISNKTKYHNDVVMGAMAFQITSFTIVTQPFIEHRSKKTSKVRVTGLCAGNSPVTGEIPVQMASNAEKVSIWWRHHELYNDIQPTFWLYFRVILPYLLSAILVSSKSVTKNAAVRAAANKTYWREIQQRTKLCDHRRTDGRYHDAKSYFGSSTQFSIGLWSFIFITFPLSWHLMRSYIKKVI